MFLVLCVYWRFPLTVRCFCLRFMYLFKSSWADCFAHVPIFFKARSIRSQEMGGFLRDKCSSMFLVFPIPLPFSTPWNHPWLSTTRAVPLCHLSRILRLFRCIWFFLACFVDAKKVPQNKPTQRRTSTQMRDSVFFKKCTVGCINVKMYSEQWIWFLFVLYQKPPINIYI